MQIALVNISHRPWMDKPCFPTGLAYVATAMKHAGYKFDIIDIDAHRHTEGQLETLLGRKNYDVIATGALVSGYKYVKSVTSIARRTNPQAIIVAGNSVATSIPHHLLTHTEVDVTIKGEGEITMCNLLRAVKKGKGTRTLRQVKGLVFLDKGEVVDTGDECPIRDISSLPFPDWELFDIGLYLRKFQNEIPEPYPMPKDQITMFLVNTARGCPFRCSFCYHVFQGTRYRYRSAESIIAEIAELQRTYGVNYVNFYDEVSFCSKKQIRRFLDVKRESGLEFFWNANARGNLFTERDVDLLCELREAGCVSFGYSLESADPDILGSMNKKITVDQFRSQKLALDKAGIHTFTSIVIGFPQETLKTIKKTFDVCYELGLYPSTGYLLPQPGTPMFEAARQAGFGHDLESFLNQMGDRQDLRFNLTKIPDDILQAEVKRHLERISDKLGLGFRPEHLLKTFTFVLSNAHDV